MSKKVSVQVFYFIAKIHKEVLTNSFFIDMSTVLSLYISFVTIKEFCQTEGRLHALKFYS